MINPPPYGIGRRQCGQHCGDGRRLPFRWTRLSVGSVQAIGRGTTALRMPSGNAAVNTSGAKPSWSPRLWIVRRYRPIIEAGLGREACDAGVWRWMA